MSMRPIEPWSGDVRRLTLRDLLTLVALLALPLAVVGTTARSDRDPVIKAIVIGTSLVVPGVIGLTWAACRVSQPRGSRPADFFVVVYIGLTFLSVLAVITVFMLDKPMSGLLGLALFGLLAYLSSWV